VQAATMRPTGRLQTEADLLLLGVLLLLRWQLISNDTEGVPLLLEAPEDDDGVRPATCEAVLGTVLRFVAPPVQPGPLAAPVAGVTPAALAEVRV
jgi:hypothetical protein